MRSKIEYFLKTFFSFNIFLFFIFFSTYIFIKFFNFEHNFNHFYILWSFSFYFFSIVISFFMLQFLGLYGVYFMCSIGLGALWLSLLLFINSFYLDDLKLFFSLFKWFKLNSDTDIFFDIYIDNISYSFMLLTSTIGIAVNIYALTYFRYEPNIERLILLLNSFIFSMLLLVSAGNLIVLFLGWELIGITSYLLINFWINRATTFKSSFKAYSFNKFSDCSLFLGILIIILNSKNFTIPFLINNTYIFNELVSNFPGQIKLIELFSFFFLSAAFIKSAQVFCHIWLPDSMEAPVPASALIHSATLVSAGIFLILRFLPIFELSNYFFFIAGLIGSITAFVGGFSALFQTDLKRILAYSTISHCGFLVFLTTSFNVSYVLFYLFIHGFFKASSFLSAGNVIRFSKNYQDIRRMGGYWKYLPAELFFLSFSLLNLSGLPFFFGFYAKHLLFLESTNFFLSSACMAFLFLAALSGIFYSFKIIFYVFFDTKKNYKSVYLSYNTSTFFSRYYTNSTLAGLSAILFLNIAGYFLSYILINKLILKNLSLLNTSNFYLFTNDILLNEFNTNWLFNFGFFNLTVLILSSYLIFFRWNYMFNRALNIDNFFFYILVLSFCSLISFFF